jgi:hypothetical protein
VVVPWYLYIHDGDEGILREQYDGMREYVDYWYSVTEDGIVPNDYGKYSDWLAFDNTDPAEPRRGCHTTCSTRRSCDIYSTLSRGSPVSLTTGPTASGISTTLTGSPTRSTTGFRP